MATQAFVEREVERTDLRERVERTLGIMHAWGYAPTIDVLSASLIGGTADVAAVQDEAGRSGTVRLADDFVVLAGREDLLEDSRRRSRSHRALNGHAVAIAHGFARDLAGVCPFVDCVALSGSVASGGFAPGDDVDFDLFVRPGTKYTSYLLATLVGLRYAWRHRGDVSRGAGGTPILPKVTCINVVWPGDQARPFVRQDASLAFELLRCRPLYGSGHFRGVLRANPWVSDFFPQVFDRTWTDQVVARKATIADVLEGVAKQPRVLAIVERWSRRVSRVLYEFVQASRTGDPAAVERLAFLRRVKFPYEVFQD